MGVISYTVSPKKLLGVYLLLFNICSSSIALDVVKILWERWGRDISEEKMTENINLFYPSLPSTDKGSEFPSCFDLLLFRLSKTNREVSMVFSWSNAKPTGAVWCVNPVGQHGWACSEVLKKETVKIIKITRQIAGRRTIIKNIYRIQESPTNLGDISLGQNLVHTQPSGIRTLSLFFVF